jgi:MFS transporter, DHA1 family, multidrug resistance protein
LAAGSFAKMAPGHARCSPHVSRALVLPAAMFFGSFAWSFVYVSLPFYIQAMSGDDTVTTLRWTGWILGISPLITVLTAPLWGRAAERADPKQLYVLVEVLQGVAFFAMALARTLPELFFARLVLGIMGAASTFAFVMVGRGADSRTVRRQIAAIQSAMTVGQVIGPLGGAIAAARLGFRASFVVGGLILLACGTLVRWGLPSVPETSRQRQAGRRVRIGDVAAVAVIVLGGNVQVFFLTAILPVVLPDLGVDTGRTLEVGGFVIFASGLAAALGALAAPRLGELAAEHRLIAGLLIASSLLVAALWVVESVWWYGALRFLQVLCIAPVFPLVVARIAQHGGGQAIGVLNSARIGAAFIGPVLATTVLAWASPAVLHVLLAAVGLAGLPAVRRHAVLRTRSLSP